ncbi:hypothetical protein [uncultured Winogradskyella sp.]|tara:strand:+ start:3778 stop:3921 length:144 start_codon:yes stop_codon:yes gene_type:complete
MQHHEAKHLRKVTPKEISDNCDHNFEKEYYLGTDTGDKVCSKCGKEK